MRMLKKTDIQLFLLLVLVLISLKWWFAFVQTNESNGFYKPTGNNLFDFASSFQNNMVLQMQPHRAVIWGYGTVGAVVDVHLLQDVYTTNVIEGSNKQGIWKVVLKQQPAGGPHVIRATHSFGRKLTRKVLKNVLFGDVWVCGGQSNMQFTLGMVFNASEEISLASNYPNIRIMTVGRTHSDVPLNDFQRLEQPWSLPSKDSLNSSVPWTYFSAVCWLFGRQLHDRLKVPIGLISSNWPGTLIETWSSSKALKECDLDRFSRMRPSRPNIPNQNSVLWNAMIRPMINTTIKGVIWYQGEENTRFQTDEYSCSFPAMIKDWRESWFDGTSEQSSPEFPFGFVQISTRGGTDDGSFPLIRWHQTAGYGYAPNSKMPNTFMAVAMDLGDPDSPYRSTHPRDKQDVAYRLVLGALNVAYGQRVTYRGPKPRVAHRTFYNLVVLVHNRRQKLLVKENHNFMVCCSFSDCDYSKSPSSNWIWAPITSYTNNTITLDTKACAKAGGIAKMIRYAWALRPCEFKQCSVYNDAGLPAPPYVIEVPEDKVQVA